MVVVPKLHGDIHICKDFKPLNGNVLQVTSSFIALCRWGNAQQKTFQDIKAQLTDEFPTLALYRPDTPTKIFANAFAYWLEAVIFQ
jgi:hypothetical protein